jgi:anionic cell wall polymer biosynthesis LytR-Cps2A-Psr (LCP) family protein
MRGLSLWLVCLASFIFGWYAIGIFFQRDKLQRLQPTLSNYSPNSVESGGGDNLNKEVTFLLLGYGGQGHDGGYLSDSLMLLNINFASKEIVLISVPRDLWVSIPVRSDEKINRKINAAYAIGLDDEKYPLKEPRYKGEFGGGRLVSAVVENLFDITIDGFVAVDFSSFEKIIDTLGGIDVDVPKTFDDYFYPIKGKENDTCGFSPSQIEEFHMKYSGFELEKQFTCRYEHLHFDKGRNHMDGKTALKFVRSRHSSQYGGDFARSQRQKEVLLAAKDKLLTLTAVKKHEDIYEEFKNLVKTDITKDVVLGLAKSMGDVSQYKMKFAGLTEENVLMAAKSFDGQFILIPKKGEGVWDDVREFIREQIGS